MDRVDEVLGQVLIGVDPAQAIDESKLEPVYEPDKIRGLLAVHGYRQVVEGNQVSRDQLEGRERYKHEDGTMVYLDMNPFNNEGRGRWTFHHAAGVHEGYSHKHLAHVLGSWALRS
jgi:hypothetical protein